MTVFLCSYNQLQLEKRDVPVEFEGKEHHFEFWHRDLWKTIVSVVQDPELASTMEWDATKLEKFDGREWKRFIHEPFTADRMWESQVCLQCFLPSLTLTNSWNEVRASKPRREAPWYHTLCRQNKTFFVWNNSGISDHGSACPITPRCSQWKRSWGYSGCWLDSYCKSAIHINPAISIFTEDRRLRRKMASIRRRAPISSVRCGIRRSRFF
jgi:hypothetical protein